MTNRTTRSALATNIRKRWAFGTGYVLVVIMGICAGWSNLGQVTCEDEPLNRFEDCQKFLTLQQNE